MDRREALSGEDEPFLARWSRRKQEAREQTQTALGEEPAAEAAADAAPAAPSSAVPPQQEPEPGVLTDEDMPPIESLTDDADYSGFLSTGVSEVLRQQALRRLFSSPKFNVTDGLDDFAEDYTQFAPLGDVVTADMKHRMERLLDRLGSGEVGEGEFRADEQPGGSESAKPSEDAIPASSQDDAVAGEHGVGSEFVALNEPQRHRGTEE